MYCACCVWQYVAWDRLWANASSWRLCHREAAVFDHRGGDLGCVHRLQVGLLYLSWDRAASQYAKWVITVTPQLTWTPLRVRSVSAGSTARFMCTCAFASSKLPASNERVKWLSACAAGWPPVFPPAGGGVSPLGGWSTGARPSLGGGTTPLPGSAGSPARECPDGLVPGRSAAPAAFSAGTEPAPGRCVDAADVHAPRLALGASCCCLLSGWGLVGGWGGW